MKRERLRFVVTLACFLIVSLPDDFVRLAARVAPPLDSVPLKPLMVVVAAVLYFAFDYSWGRRETKAPGGVDWFRRTVEETMHAAIDLGFNPTVAPNETGSRSAVYHADPDGNMIKLLELEVVADGSSEADFMTIIEKNRERLTEIAKKFGAAQKERQGG